MLPHPAAPTRAGVATICPRTGAAGQVCARPVDPHQHHCCVCRHGGGVDQRHLAVARCLADLITSHSGTKVYIEHMIPGLTRVVRNRVEQARMDLNGVTTFLDVAIATPFSSNAGLISAASAKPGYMAKREEKKNLDLAKTSNKPLVGLKKRSQRLKQQIRDLNKTNGRLQKQTKRLQHKTPKQTHGRLQPKTNFGVLKVLFCRFFEGTSRQ